MNYNIILEDIELGIEDVDLRVYNIYFNGTRNLIAVSEDCGGAGRVVKTFELTKLPKELTLSQQEQILDYCGLSIDEEGYPDESHIFMHGQFVKKSEI